jgi:GMP synthase-like glutamine amidotransferase
MKPVLILQNLHDDGPAFFATWLRTKGVPFEVFNAQAGQSYPQSMTPYSALAVLGGSMSANDDLSSLREAERLILESMMQQRPVIGHCLGGQLMARALGAKVRPGQQEIGWHPIRLTPEGVVWFDELTSPTVFQWHKETFDLPSGAELLASSPACPNQAFAVGPHLAMQFHVELDEPKLINWLHQMEAAGSFQGTTLPLVQSPKAIMEQARLAMSDQQRFASRIYERWMRSAITDEL